MKVKYSLEIESELWSNKDEEHLIKVLNNDLPYLRKLYEKLDKISELF